LNIGTQPNITTPATSTSNFLPRNFLAVKEFVRQQSSDAEKKKSRIAVKNEMVMKLQKLGMTEDAERLRRCCQTFQTLHCPVESIVWRKFPDYRCNLSFCPDCWDKKAIRELNRVLPKFLTAVRVNPKLKSMPLTLTLPPKAGRSKKQGERELKRAYKKLSRRKCFQNVSAGYVRIENPISNGHWHPHIHATLLVDGQLSEQAVKDNWFEITGAHQVKLIKIKNAEDALAGTLVYPFKPADLMKATAEQVAELIASKGDKLGWTHGDIYGLDAGDNIGQSNDPHAAFIAETKKLREGDACPSCGSKLVTGRYAVNDLINLIASAKIVGTTYPKCRGH
jgi:hypothetical protein